MKRRYLQFCLTSIFLLISISVNSAIQVDTFLRTLGVQNLAIADGLIAGTTANNGTATALPNFVDYWNTVGTSGHFMINSAFPGTITNFLALHATCPLVIPVTGAYTFGTNNDDGARLKIDATTVILDDTLHGPTDFFGTITLTAGFHNLDLVFFDNGGGAAIELFAAPGTFAAFDPSMRLVGDTTNGGLICNTGAAQVDVSITNTDGVTTATPGSSLTYTIVANNAGPNNDPAVTVADTFPTGLTCTYTSVAAGGATGNTAGAGNLAETLNMPIGSSVTYTAICNIPSSATGTLINTATITSSITDPIPANNTATDNDTVLTPSADLTIANTDGVTSAVPGSATPLTYTIVASNAGPSDNPTTVSVTDTFPTGLTCTYTSVAAGGATGNTAAGTGNLAETTLNMPNGSSVTYTAVCNIASSATGTLSNTATISSASTDPTPANNSATDNNTVLTPMADLSVVINGPTVVATPGSITYNIDVTNSGPSDATNVVVTDTLSVGFFTVTTVGCTNDPSGYPNCNLGTLTSGSTSSYSVTFDVGSVSGNINNSVNVTSDATDPTPANNSGAAAVILATPRIIPTFSQLGLIIAMLLIFAFGVYSIPKRRL
ncbi:MAG: PA14 domain-containing protein [Bacteroidota bacterium]